MTPAQRRALALAIVLFPEKAERITTYDRRGTKAIGWWYDFTDMKGKKGKGFRAAGDVHGRHAESALGTSWPEVEEKLRNYVRNDRRNAAAGAGFILAAFEAAAEGFDVREPCAQLQAWIVGDPLQEGDEP